MAKDKKDKEEEAAPKVASKSTGLRYRLPNAPKGECKTGIIFEENQVNIVLKDGSFEVQSGMYADSRQYFFIQALLKNGFEEVKKGD